MLADTPLNGGPSQRANEIKSLHHNFQINDIKTEMMAQKFKNRIVINITQCQSFGSILDIRKDEGQMMNVSSDIGISVRFLLGEQHPIYKILANKIGETVFRETELPVLLTLALKDKTTDMFKTIMLKIAEIDVWSIF